MKISLSWLKELIDFKLSSQELADQLSLKSIGIKQITQDYIELDLTYNRGDLLSLRGIAREVAAITNSKLNFKDEAFPKFNLPKTPVKVENPNLCPVYCVVKIENLKVGQSDKSWVKKLSDSSVRSINNIADITNLVMLEYGQPMHAFDSNKVNGEIFVRLAKKEEKIATLDNKIRNLSEEDLLITDKDNPIGIAGVMGGKDSEISGSTTTILLEAAIFDPVSIRKTSKRHGLYSEASKRFQHGLTKTNLLQALVAAIKMYEELGGKLTAISLVGNLEDQPKTVPLSQQKINSLLGVDIPSNQVELSLKSLSFLLRGVRTNEWEVIVPYWRLDIELEEDLIEEIARMYGYEKIEGIKLNHEKIPELDQTLPNFIYDLKLKLKDLGLTEVQTYSFYSTQIIENLKLKIENLIHIANPISSETEYMRMDLWPNLVEVVGKNIRQGFKNIAVFEIGKVYKNEDGEPQENYRLSIALMNGSDNPIEELSALSSSHPKGVKLNPNYMHPKRRADGMGEVHLRLLNKLGIEKRVAVMETELEPLISLRHTQT